MDPPSQFLIVMICVSVYNQADSQQTLRDLRLEFAEQISLLTAERKNSDVVETLFRGKKYTATFVYLIYSAVMANYYVQISKRYENLIFLSETDKNVSFCFPVTTWFSLTFHSILTILKGLKNQDEPSVA